MSVLLLVVILVLYESTIGGDEGAYTILQERGGKADLEIGGISP